MQDEGKTEVAGYYKLKDGVVINKDKIALQAYKMKKRQINKINLLETDLNNLKNDITEIKNLLKGLVK